MRSLPMPFPTIDSRPALVSRSGHRILNPAASTPGTEARVQAMLLIPAYLTILLAVEVLTNLTTDVLPFLGWVLYGIVELVLLLHTALCWDRPLRYLPGTLAFAPAIRLVLLWSRPAPPAPYAYLSITVPVVAAALVALCLRPAGAQSAAQATGGDVPAGKQPVPSAGAAGPTLPDVKRLSESLPGGRAAPISGVVAARPRPGAFLWLPGKNPQPTAGPPPRQASRYRLNVQNRFAKTLGLPSPAPKGLRHLHPAARQRAATPKREAAGMSKAAESSLRPISAIKGAAAGIYPWGSTVAVPKVRLRRCAQGNLRPAAGISRRIGTFAQRPNPALAKTSAGVLVAVLLLAVLFGILLSGVGNAPAGLLPERSFPAAPPTPTVQPREGAALPPAGLLYEEIGRRACLHLVQAGLAARPATRPADIPAGAGSPR